MSIANKKADQVATTNNVNHFNTYIVIKQNKTL